jgi:hypothetical protein
LHSIVILYVHSQFLDEIRPHLRVLSLKKEEVLKFGTLVFGEDAVAAVLQYLEHPSRRTASKLPPFVNKIVSPRDGTSAVTTVESLWPNEETKQP